ncbi:MAG: Rad52/Rad22 family DNA repair protein [Planctomycetota bacterium]|jgi:hypothetical protein
MTIDFELLHKPFPKNEVKTRPGGGGKVLDFITARHVMNRLDNACGPENWRDEYAPSLTGEGVQCTIYIRIDGEWVGKSDVGTESNTEEDKGAYSDALKRAAVRWGIARELHKDGLSNLAKQSQPSELDEVVWTRDRKRVTKLRDLASEHWTDDDGKPMAYPHVHTRIAILIGSELRPVTLDAFMDMMEHECKLDPKEMMDAIEGYKAKE